MSPPQGSGDAFHCELVGSLQLEDTGIFCFEMVCGVFVGFFLKLQDLINLAVCCLFQSEVTRKLSPVFLSSSFSFSLKEDFARHAHPFQNLIIDNLNLSNVTHISNCKIINMTKFRLIGHPAQLGWRGEPSGILRVIGLCLFLNRRHNVTDLQEFNSSVNLTVTKSFSVAESLTLSYQLPPLLKQYGR